MAWWQYILLVVVLIIENIIILVFEHSVPSYLKKKGENIATKQDIAEITKKTEEIQRDFKENLTRFSSDLKFKYDYYYKQYSDLYCILYAMIVESEYARFFIESSQGYTISHENFPFIEVSPVIHTASVKTKTTIDNESQPNTISFHKIRICKTIIENGNLATQRLLKLAVSYQFVCNISTDGNNINSHSYGEDEEYQLIKQITECIVQEYNYFRKELNMDYDENELKTGIITS